MDDKAGRVQVCLETRSRGLVAFVTIDRQGRLNALTAALMDRLRAEIEKLGRNDELRALVLTGAGERAFIGGADISEMAELDASSARAFIMRVHDCCAALRDLPVPVIARIHGYAFGAGLEIAAACDLRLASHAATFGMPEVRLGIPSVVEAALLPTLIGWGRARRLLLLGETCSAAEAERWGLVERVVPRQALDEAVQEWLGFLMECGPGAIRLQKRLIRQWESLPLSEAIAAGVDCFVEAWRAAEPRLAMQSFLAERARRRQV